MLAGWCPILRRALTGRPYEGEGLPLHNRLVAAQFIAWKRTREGVCSGTCDVDNAIIRAALVQYAACLERTGQHPARGIFRAACATLRTATVLRSSTD